jgi:uncharacterized OB-fold protein
MPTGQPNRPIPVPSRHTQEFWEAAKRRQLMIQRCASCHNYLYPPALACPKCGSADLTYTPVSGRGIIYAPTVIHQPLVQGFERAVPYACIAVELQEQPGLLVVGNLVEAPPEAARVGLPVEVTFEEIGEGYLLPQFRPRDRA